MKLTALPADKGDCLLLESADGKRVLVDGGVADTYREQVAPILTQRGIERLDLVYVSHIDEDHISGILELLDNLVEWRVHDHRVRKAGAQPVAPPTVPRPPEVEAIWHNAFGEQVRSADQPDPVGPIQSVLETGLALLSGTTSSDFVAFSIEHQELIESIEQAIRVSRRIGTRQLKLRLNEPFNGGLMTVQEAAPPIRVGKLRLSVIGPFQKDLDNLREDWDKWLRKSTDELAQIRARALVDEERLASNQVDLLRRLSTAQANALGAALEARGAQLENLDRLGKRSRVTAPNLASLMLLVEEGRKRLLLTGDGHHTDIVEGLNVHKKLDANGRAHVDVMKVPHHGAEFNANLDFFHRITANQYVFCANGEHENPDRGIVEAIFEARRGSAPYKLWFSNSDVTVLAEVARIEANDPSGGTTRKRNAAKHMRGIQDLVAQRAAAAEGQVAFDFRGGPSRTWPHSPPWLAAAPGVAVVP